MKPRPSRVAPPDPPVPTTVRHDVAATAGILGSAIMLCTIPLALFYLLFAGLTLSRDPGAPSGYVLPCTSPSCIHDARHTAALTLGVLIGAVVTVIVTLRPRRIWLAIAAVTMGWVLVQGALAHDALGNALIPVVAMLLAILGAWERLPARHPRAG